MEFVGARENCNCVESDVMDMQPDVVLMDIDMPGTNGIEGMKRIKIKAPAVFIIMQLVFEDDEKIFTAIHAGAHGYFLKKTNPDKLIEGIRDVLEGGAPMTPSYFILFLLFGRRSRQSPKPVITACRQPISPA